MRNAPPALGLVRPRRPVRRPRRPVADVGVAELEQLLRATRRVAVAPVRPRGWLSGAGALEFALRRFAEALRLRLDQGGIEQRREMLVERMDFGPRGFGVRRAGGLSWGRAWAGIWGESRGGGRAGNAPSGIGLNSGRGDACSVGDQIGRRRDEPGCAALSRLRNARWASAPSPGAMRGSSRFQLPAKSAEAAERLMRRRAPGAEAGAPPEEVAAVVAAAKRYFDGEETDFSHVRLDLGGEDAFFPQIYDALRRVGWGRTTSYGALAKEVGAGREAARDVGQAMARNPAPLIIPCHRVLAAGGKIGGFSAPGGSRTKMRMLELEGVRVGPPEAAQQVLRFLSVILPRGQRRTGVVEAPILHRRLPRARRRLGRIFQWTREKVVLACFGQLAISPRGPKCLNVHWGCPSPRSSLRRPRA